MLFLRTPSDTRIRAILETLRDAPFTHDAVGRIEDELRSAPDGFVLDRYGTELGEGDAVFERARAALSGIQNYPPSFTRVVRATAGPLVPGALFATVVRHLGFVSVLPCRLLFVVDEPTCFSFAFGTLPGHAECGEERFRVRREDGRVRYEVQAFSRPHGLLARLGAPVARYFQRRFQRETMQQMRDMSTRL